MPRSDCQMPRFWWTFQFSSRFDVLLECSECFVVVVFCIKLYGLTFQRTICNMALTRSTVYKRVLEIQITGLLFAFGSKSALCWTENVFGRMSRIVWHLRSHVPIRHLWFVITCQPLRLRRSGSHTWLHLDYILPPARLIWLFMDKRLSRKAEPNLSQLLGKHGLGQKQAAKPSVSRRRVRTACQSAWRQTFPIGHGVHDVQQV